VISICLIKASFDQLWSATVVGGAGTCFVVVYMCCLVSRICPRDASFDLGRFFLIKSELMPGRVTKCPASIAFIQVDRTKKNAALCRYLANLGKDAYVYALFTAYLCAYLLC